MRILCIPDSHVPYHDKRAMDLAIKVAKILAPEHIVFLGDFVDCYSISDHCKDPARGSKLKNELQRGRAILVDFYAANPQSRIHYLEGNHEQRIERYIAKRAPELYGMVSVRKELGVEESNWTPYREALKLGKCYFAHDVGYCGKDAARKSLEAFGGNLIFGHAHRADIAYDGNLRGERHFAVCSGWLGDPKMIDYASKPRVRSWQHGVTIVDQSTNGNSWATFVPFIAGKCTIDGKEISL